MASIKHVLVATDGSETALKAAAFAGEVARALGARVSVLLVQTDELVVSGAWGAGSAMTVDQVRADLERQAEETELPETVKAVGKLEDEVEALSVWGHPATAITRFATEQAVDLIVIGSHGRSGLKEALLGSVSHAVANHAPCPVTIVR
jgi:nucleotide-binding universal stress UspA family protein